MKYPPIQVVDEHDEPLRGATLEEVRKLGLWYRVVRVSVEDNQGRLLLQKRSNSVLTFPNCWDTSAAGHVDEREDYITAAKREMAEEIGLEGFELEEVEYYKLQWVHKGVTLKRFSKTYRTVVGVDQNFTPEPSEVADLKWFTEKQIRDLFKIQPGLFTDGLKHLLKLET